MKTRTLGMIAALCLASGCDVGAGLEAAQTTDTRVGDGDAEVAETAAETVAPEVTGPSAAGEVPMTRGTGSDDLFPSLDGDDLAWVRVRFDASLAPGATDVDCMACPYCGGCVAEVWHKRLPGGEEAALAGGRGVRSAPTVGDGRIVWVADDGTTKVHTLGTGRTTSLALGSYGNSSPVAAKGKLWWYAYDSPTGAWALMQLDPVTGQQTLATPAGMNDGWWASGGLQGLGVGQPFSLGAARVVWSNWERLGGGASDGYGFAIHSWAFAGEVAAVSAPPSERDHMHPLLTANDTLVTMNYLRADGCGGSSCELALTAFGPGGEPRELASGGKPSLLVEPIATGDRVAWLDHRDGPYQIWSVDLARPNAAVRMTSDTAVIGTLSTFTASARGVAWADRRSGRWRIVMRAW